MNKLIPICLFYIFSLATADAHPGIGIVMDSQGNVFYTDLTHVWKISPNRNRTIAVKNVHTHELYLDEQDNLYGEHEYYKGEATDKWGNYVWCLSKDGLFEKTIPEVEGFLDNNTLVRDNLGNSYWSKKSGDFQILNKQDSSVTGHRFNDIRWMHYSKADSNLYVVDNLSIKQVSPTGQTTVIAESLKEDTPPFEGVADRHYIFGVWTDNRSNVNIAVYGARKVVQIDVQGDIKTLFESEKGWSPCGGITSPDGTLWILEFSKNNATRVTKVSTK